MSVMLSKSEREELGSKFNFRFENKALPTTCSIHAIELLDEEKCASYLDQLAAEIGSPSRRVTASMLAKRYAYLAVVPVLYAMTVFDKGLGLTLYNCLLASPDDDEYSLSKSRFPNLSLDGLNVTEPEVGNRGDWREHVVRQLFEEHLSPLFHSLSIVGGVPRSVLWENVMVRITPLYEDQLEEEEDPSILIRLHDDFKFITETAPASLFRERRNPFAMFHNTKNTEHTDNQAAYIRKTCCFYFEMSPEYCRACPKPLNSHF
ncbi:IucA/IucC family C-terminal-domain containing protein [Paenibacillus sinopodophylli]|uniref:IucA/IucC family C-terminal-domain containing protein n=1 Tax=Paenibacillus sinopodophylli TaxID=1837342 RepID=UPI00110C9ED9|nr:IucA/IucC family C-terminal-domain containing protein [Paenibacillus sinopodophylli]